MSNVLAYITDREREITAIYFIAAQCLDVAFDVWMAGRRERQREALSRALRRFAADLGVIGNDIIMSPLADNIARSATITKS